MIIGMGFRDYIFCISLIEGGRKSILQFFFWGFIREGRCCVSQIGLVFLRSRLIEVVRQIQSINKQIFWSKMLVDLFERDIIDKYVDQFRNFDFDFFFYQMGMIEYLLQNVVRVGCDSLFGNICYIVLYRGWFILFIFCQIYVKKN